MNKESEEYKRVREEIAKELFYAGVDEAGSSETLVNIADQILSIKGIAIEADNQSKLKTNINTLRADIINLRDSEYKEANFRRVI